MPVKAPIHSSASKLPLLSLQAWQLKQLALLIGLGPGTNKHQTTQGLVKTLQEPRLESKQFKTLSIDMGVKNLAFCVLRHDTLSPSASSTAKSQTASLFHLQEWKRWDVTKVLATPKISDPTEANNTSHLWTPSNLSKIAYLLASRFLSYKPNSILIERQRFRSGGAAAIQEWTVRVNMLEAMLWSSFETQRHATANPSKEKPASFPETIGMSPARVGAFWNSRARQSQSLGVSQDIERLLDGSKRSEWETDGINTIHDDEDSKGGSKAKAKRGFEKKEKIDLVRNWFERGDLTYDDSLSSTVESFTSKKGKRKGGPTSDDEILEFQPDRMNKMDDLADCVVQAVTYAKWEQNRQAIAELDRLSLNDGDETEEHENER